MEIQDYFKKNEKWRSATANNNYQPEQEKSYVTIK